MTTNFKISPTLNPNKFFLLQKSELEKRLDPFYYVPPLVALEKKILAHNPKRLREYVKSIASGATPKTTESEKYYADKTNGKPFLRVQNLSPTGILEFEDCKYINEETHKGMLYRSQVAGGDLLVKITGVGRMAVASVAPEGFEGNINQHICVIKTGDKAISETIAAFLNSDIGEKLASRRSTGGTRPALDYPALLSIPVIYDERIVEITKKVVNQKKHNEAQADKLLASIADYLLNELGIILLDLLQNTLKNRIFTTSLKEVSGTRLDPFYFQAKYKLILEMLQKGYYKIEPLRHLITDLKNGVEIRNYVDEGKRYLRVTDLSKFGINNNSKRFVAEQEVPEKIRLNKDCILVSRSGSLGLINIVNDEIIDSILSSHIFKVELMTKKIQPLYLETYLRSSIGQSQFFRNNNGGVIPEINQDALKSILIPVPPLEKQQEIADHITSIRRQAQLLKDQTKTALENASREIERILLNN
jgi:restriction endonuclease S subunit